MRYASGRIKTVSLMKELLTLLSVALGLISCATTDTKPIYRGRPTYPNTLVRLASGNTLTHQAGPTCNSEDRPEVGVSDRERTYSEWYLRSNLDQRVILRSPSFLSDPKGAGEFEDYYRRNDLVEVFESTSGDSILIVEDRSPTFARRAYILLRKDINDRWGYKELLLDPYLPSRISGTNDPRFSGPPDWIYPDIIELSDTHIRFTSRDGIRKVAINKLPTKG